MALPQLISQCRKTESLVLFFLFEHGYFIHAGIHGLVLPISFMIMRLYLNVGIVNMVVLSFLEHFLFI